LQKKLASSGRIKGVGGAILSVLIAGGAIFALPLWRAS